MVLDPCQEVGAYALSLHLAILIISGPKVQKALGITNLIAGSEVVAVTTTRWLLMVANRYCVVKVEVQEEEEVAAKQLKQLLNWQC